jgi:hypothetical protein
MNLYNKPFHGWCPKTCFKVPHSGHQGDGFVIEKNMRRMSHEHLYTRIAPWVHCAGTSLDICAWSHTSVHILITLLERPHTKLFSPAKREKNRAHELFVGHWMINWLTSYVKICITKCHVQLYSTSDIQYIWIQGCFSILYDSHNNTSKQYMQINIIFRQFLPFFIYKKIISNGRRNARDSN